MQQYLELLLNHITHTPFTTVPLATLVFTFYCFFLPEKESEFIGEPPYKPVSHKHGTPGKISTRADCRRFPFVRTDRPDHSRHNENFTFNQNYLAR